MAEVRPRLGRSRRQGLRRQRRPGGNPDGLLRVWQPPAVRGELGGSVPAKDHVHPAPVTIAESDRLPSGVRLPQSVRASRADAYTQVQPPPGAAQRPTPPATTPDDADAPSARPAAELTEDSARARPSACLPMADGAQRPMMVAPSPPSPRSPALTSRTRGLLAASALTASRSAPVPEPWMMVTRSSPASAASSR